MDIGAWRATVHGVSKSQTRLYDWACMQAYIYAHAYECLFFHWECNLMSPIPMTYWKWQLAFVPWRNELVPPGANTSFLKSNPECSSNLIQQTEVSELVCHSERRLQTRTACWRIIKMESGLWEHGSSSPLIIFPLVTDRCQQSGSQIYLKNVSESRMNSSLWLNMF